MLFLCYIVPGLKSERFIFSGRVSFGKTTVDLIHDKQCLDLSLVQPNTFKTHFVKLFYIETPWILVKKLPESSI